MADYTILLIDYEPRSIDQLRSPLVTAGYRVEVAKDGITGARRFAELEPDLTLIEAMLPKKHGFDLCKELKSTEHGRRSPVLIVTAVYKGNKYRSQATRHYGCDAYVEKPISGETLVAMVRGFLEPERVSATSEEDIADPLDTVLPGDDRSATDDEPGGQDERVDPPSDAESGRIAAEIGTSLAFGVPQRSAAEPTAGGGGLSTQGALAVADRRDPGPAAPTAAPATLKTGETDAPPGVSRSRWGRIWIWIAFAAMLALGGTLAILLR